MENPDLILRVNAETLSDGSDAYNVTIFDRIGRVTLKLDMNSEADAAAFVDTFATAIDAHTNHMVLKV